MIYSAQNNHGTGIALPVNLFHSVAEDSSSEFISHNSELFFRTMRKKSEM